MGDFFEYETLREKNALFSFLYGANRAAAPANDTRKSAMYDRTLSEERS